MCHILEIYYLETIGHYARARARGSLMSLSFQRLRCVRGYAIVIRHVVIILTFHVILFSSRGVKLILDREHRRVPRLYERRECEYFFSTMEQRVHEGGRGA